jgi:diguanylate cyclase (GGDEF)-like protein
MSFLSLLNDPKHWHHRAARTRALAESLTDAVGKATALSIAEEYDRLGKRAEDRQLARIEDASLAATRDTPDEAEVGGKVVRLATGRTPMARMVLPVTYAIVGVIVGIVVFLMSWSYQDAWTKARHNAENVVRALQTDIAHNIDLYDSSLRGIRAALDNPAVAGAAPEQRRLLLAGLAQSARHLGSIRILNAKGEVVADSEGVTSTDSNFAERDYFEIHRQSVDTGLYISGPFKDRLARGADSVALSRKLSDRDGAFAGVVVAVLPLTYFRELFQRLDIGRRGVISLISTDGTVLVRQPALRPSGDAGLRVDRSPNFQRILDEKSGFFAAPFATDGVNRLRAFRQIEDLPLIVAVSPAVGDIYAEWWHRALWSATITLLVCAGIVMLTAMFKRELQRRELAEADLAALAMELSTAATTDGLTGLPNRRSFDLLLQREWRRAARNDRWVSLLMIDIDHFKAFNDRHGHVVGDEVLRVLAKSIELCARRPGDRGARYGGEEFAIVLPDTDTSGARIVAQRLRTTFTERGRDQGLADRLPTVSIGVSALKPGAGGAEIELLKSADAALYRAKESGRDQIQSAAGSDQEHKQAG